MKTIFVFIFALFCFTSIKCSSWTWKDCGAGGDVAWVTTNITFAESPVIGQNATGGICMENPSPVAWEISKIGVFSLNSADISTEFKDETQLHQGESKCWNLIFPIPERVPQDLKVQIFFMSEWMIFGCGEVDFNFATSEKFLSFY